MDQVSSRVFDICGVTISYCSFRYLAEGGMIYPLGLLQEKTG